MGISACGILSSIAVIVIYMLFFGDHLLEKLLLLWKRVEKLLQSVCRIPAWGMQYCRAFAVLSIIVFAVITVSKINIVPCGSNIAEAAQLSSTAENNVVKTPCECD